MKKRIRKKLHKKLSNKEMVKYWKKLYIAERNMHDKQNGMLAELSLKVVILKKQLENAKKPFWKKVLHR